MNRYWDLTNKQRSLLTYDQVKALLEVELMEKGVLAVPKPELITTEPVALIKETYYVPHYKGEYSDQAMPFAFRSAEDCERFFEMDPLIVMSKWDLGKQEYVATPKEMKIVPSKYPAEIEVMAAAVTLKANKAAEEKNRSAREAYDKAVKEVDAVTKDVWDDWHECKSLGDKYKRVRETREKYLGLCDNNSETAANFLALVFHADEIKSAEDWFSEDA